MLRALPVTQELLDDTTFDLIGWMNRPRSDSPPDPAIERQNRIDELREIIARAESELDELKAV